MKGITIFRSKSQSKYRIISLTIGIVYLWFGALKFFPGLSPAENLAVQTIHALTFGLFSDQLELILLAIWEVIVGLCLISQFFRRPALYLAIVHMVLTFTPFLFFPDLVFTQAPYGLTLVGQYIIKNLVFLAILLFLIRQPSDH